MMENQIYCVSHIEKTVEINNGGPSLICNQEQWLIPDESPYI